MGLLGKTDGFLGNPKVRIELPGFLKDAAKLLKSTGQGKRVDELVTAMNRAAEAAVPQAKQMLVGAVKSMSVSDGRKILTGGDNSVTTFFSEKTREPLGVKFLPIVTHGHRKGGAGRQVQRRRRQGGELRAAEEGRRTTSSSTSPARRWTASTS